MWLSIIKLLVLLSRIQARRGICTEQHKFRFNETDHICAAIMLSEKYLSTTSSMSLFFRQKKRNSGQISPKHKRREC